MELVLEDGYLGNKNDEDRIIKLVSNGEYNDNDIIDSVNNLMRFLYSYTSSGFVDELTRALNQRGNNNFREYRK